MNPSGQERQVRCLLVEDSGLILRDLTDTLEEMLPLKVIGCAADESAARQWLEQHGSGLDLMIVDVFLKQGTGLGVLQQANELGLTCRKVVLTNYATKEMRVRCTALQADRVFDKSSELEELIQYCADIAEHLGACS